ncbi:MAG: thioredoxin family protein [Verrucomicrobiales bacterium]|nr:thioredoxin family protein [Verrucomicrobiales bacterium]
MMKKNLFLYIGICLFAFPAFGEDSGAVQKLPKLLDLGAHKCIPCKKMTPILDELTREYKGVFDVEFIDVWQPENKEKAHAHGIQSIPTQIFFDATGKELWRHEGFISRKDILKKWKQLGFKFQAVESE